MMMMMMMMIKEHEKKIPRYVSYGKATGEL